MKRCPKCYEPYAEGVQFCELDGQPLLPDVALSPLPGEVVETEVHAQEPSAQRREVRLMGVIGLLVGVLITTMVYIGYALITANQNTPQRNEPISRVETVESRPAPRAPRTEVVEPSPAPDEDSSPSPETAEEPQAAPATEADTMTARLNNGPVSTGQRKEEKEVRAGDKTIIQMNDGTSVEVDAAWADKQGIWYRRGGLVSFVEGSRIKAIRTLEEAKPAAVSSPTP